MTAARQKRIVIIILTLLVLAGSIVSVFAIASKKGMHVDGYFSYGLSNYSGDEIYMSVESGKTYDDPSEPFLSYMTVPQGDDFSYENVWEKQTADVHPPFYYMILHTICSFFPGTFSIWFAGVINLFFFAGIILLTYKTMGLLTANKGTVFTGVLLCALSAGMIQMNTFLRMYTLLMFLTLLLTWLHLNYYEKQNLRFFIFYPLIVVGGILTHYYFFIFLCIQGIYFGISLLLRKRWRNACIYLAETLTALGVSFVIFPAITTHIFSGHRGKESFGNLTASSGYLKGLWDFLKIICGNLTGNALYVIGILFILALFYRMSTRQNSHSSFPVLWGMLICTATGFYLLVAKIGVYHYDRYISPIYPLLILLIAGMIEYLCESFLKKKQMRIALSLTLTFFCIIPSYLECDWTYLQKQTGEAVTAAKAYADLDCIVVNEGANFWNQTLYYEAQNYQSVTFLSTTQLYDYQKSQAFSEKPVAVYIMNIINSPEDVLQELIRQNTDYSHYTSLPDSAYAKGYVLE